MVRARSHASRRARGRPRRRRGAQGGVAARAQVRAGGLTWSASASCCASGPTGWTSTSAAIARSGPRCSTRSGPRAGRTIPCSSTTTGSWSATSRQRTSRRRSPAWRRRRSTPAGRPRWPSSSRCLRATGPTPVSGGSRRCSTLPDTAAQVYAAIDLGATSGRVVAARLAGDRMVLDEVHRFANRPVRLPDGLHWDVPHLFAEAVSGLRAAGSLAGVGVDTWAVDYALLDAGGRMLGLPFHYRDERTAGRVDEAFARVGRVEQYAATGIQTLPINTVFQLLSEPEAALAAADRIALIPDLLAYWLCGRLRNEATNASSTGLLDARTGAWAERLIADLQLPLGLFGPLPEAGSELAPLLGHHDLGAAPVFAVASHDTASAFAAAPVADDHAAILSSGTWSLLGLELPGPVLSDGARDANLTNERGIDGTTRLLKNVMGMWLLEESRRTWADQGHEAGYEELLALAQAVADPVPLFDPDHESFLAPGDMPARIAATWRQSGQSAPGDVATTVRSILVSLACKYRWVIERLEAVTGRDIRRIHVIGGGARNPLLCRLTADITRREVLAGPVEATALGNALVQALAAGELGSLSDIRAVAFASVRPIVNEPRGDHDDAEQTYRRFLDVTRLPAPRPTNSLEQTP